MARVYRATPGEAGSAGHPPIFVFLVLHRSLQPSLCVIHSKKTNVFRLHCPMHMLSVAFSLFVSCRSSPPLSFSLTLFLSLSFSLPLSLSLSLAPSLLLSLSRHLGFVGSSVVLLPFCPCTFVSRNGLPAADPLRLGCLRPACEGGGDLRPAWRRRGDGGATGGASARQVNKIS